MSAIAKKTGIVALAVLLTAFLVWPAFSFAEGESTAEGEQTATGLLEPAAVEQLATSTTVEVSAVTAEQVGDNIDVAVVQEEENVPASSAPSATDVAATTVTGSTEVTETVVGADSTDTAANDCTVTIEYLEYPYEIDPSKPTDGEGRVILGTRTITGLHEGDVLNAWDYVVDITGHFFFDGWPLNLTVTTDPSQNVMKLIYVKLWNAEYTVNYYEMTGADLTADTWEGALATGDVQFTKLGSETFTGQLYDKLVDGDAYEYKLEGMYVIDTYPAQIRLSEDPDNNVINVLYTPEMSDLPDDIEASDNPPVDNESTSPDDEAVEGSASSSDETTEGGSSSSETTIKPSDTTFTQDEITAVLPADDDEVYWDFVGNDVSEGELVVTDEMLANPVNPEQATTTAKAYLTGLQAANLSQTGDPLPWVIAAVAVVAAAAVIIIAAVMRRRSAKEAA